MSDLKKEVEAILFAAGRPMNILEITRLSSVKDEKKLKAILEDLKKDYDSRDTSLNILREGESYKLMIKDKYIDSVREINPHTELSKTVLETLAVIAWKTPAKQSDVIKIRTNKAYDHIATLLEMGFITKEKSGRTYSIRLTKNFFEYFDLPSESAVKAKFAHLKEEHLTEIDELPLDKLQVFELPNSPKPDGELLGGLEIVDADKPAHLKIYADGEESIPEVKLDVVDVNNSQPEPKKVGVEEDDEVDLDDVSELLNN
jgi:segregation and condensation protein B